VALTRRGMLLGGGAAVLTVAALGRRPIPPPEPLGTFAVPRQPEVDLVEHVLSRLTFGVAPGDRERLHALAGAPQAAVERWIDQQLEAPGGEDPQLQRALGRLESIGQPLGELYEWKPEVLLRQLSTAALLRAAGSRWQLREVMVELWSDH